MIYNDINAGQFKGIPNIFSELFIVYNLIFTANTMVIKGYHGSFSSFYKTKQTACTLSHMLIIKKVGLIPRLLKRFFHLHGKIAGCLDITFEKNDTFNLAL